MSKRRRRGTWGQWFSYAFFRSIEFMVGLLPVGVAVALGAGIGRVIYHVIPIRRRLIRENLAAAFPEKSARESEAIVKQSYIRLGQMTLESMKLPTLDLLTADLVVEVEGEEHLRALQAAKQTFIICTAHLGNWELLGSHYAVRGLEMEVVVKPLHNPFLNARIIKTREAVGMHLVSSRDASSVELARAAQAGRCIGLLLDQDARQFGTFVDFMGRPASTPRGAAMLAIRVQQPILPSFIVRVGGAKHKIVLRAPLWPPEKPDDLSAAVRDMTQAFTSELEAMVRQFPADYFWIHDRWKTRPEGLKEKRRRRAGLEVGGEEKEESGFSA